MIEATRHKRNENVAIGSSKQPYLTVYLLTSVTYGQEIKLVTLSLRKNLSNL